MSRQTVSKRESGQSASNLEKLVALSAYFQASTVFLLKGAVAEEQERSSTFRREQNSASRIHLFHRARVYCRPVRNADDGGGSVQLSYRRVCNFYSLL